MSDIRSIPIPPAHEGKNWSIVCGDCGGRTQGGYPASFVLHSCELAMFRVVV